MSEPAPTAAERCTSILLSAVMDYLTLSDILRGMAVSRIWSEHAINHRTYYGELRMTRHRPSGYADFILLRLSRSYGRPVSVYLELGDPNPAGLLAAIAHHIDHITLLAVRQSITQSLAPFLESLCRPAPILQDLDLLYTPQSFTRPPRTMISTDFLAGHAPALSSVCLRDIGLPSEFPQCFSYIKSLSFSGIGSNESQLALPNPFTRCTDLRSLRLSGNVSLDPAACHERRAWERMLVLSFSGSSLAADWHNLRLPLDQTQFVQVAFGTVAGALALADTISGALEITFPPLQYFRQGTDRNIVMYNAILRGASNPAITRSLAGQLSEHWGGGSSIFGMPSLTDRVVRLVLPLTGWDDLVGYSAFGPFRALEELILTLNTGDVFHPLPESKLSCPCLKRLVLDRSRKAHEHWQPVVEIRRVSTFARASLSDTVFPIKLELHCVTLSDSWNNFFPETFSSCAPVDRYLTHRTIPEEYLRFW